MAQMGIMDSFVQRFTALQEHRNVHDKLIEDLYNHCNTLLLQNAKLSEELNNAQLDLEDSTRSRREAQQAAQVLQKVVVMRDAELSRNPYVQVLIDGDGLIFNEDLIQQGVEGGKQAAAQLRSLILEQWTDLPPSLEICAKICANVAGLSKAMVRDESLAHPDLFREFTLGFSQGKASFDFVDVGHGKERADSKIKECMRWHLGNANCRQILLGISHDAGYAPFLDEVVTPEDRQRITIMEGPPTVRELHATCIKVLNFNQIFRSAKLTLKQNTATPSTWAGVTSVAVAPPPSTSPGLVKNGVKKATTPTPSKPAWVPEPRGLDSFEPVNPIVLEKLKRRTKKICNNHYLRGPCSKGEECCFEHNYKATDEDMVAIAYLTRLNPCLNGQDCDLESCIYGHHCPSTSISGKNIVCTAFGCRFGEEDHPPGTIIKHPRKEYSY